MLVIFLFLSGIAGATSLNNVAATISDLFEGSDSAGQPMALFVAGGSVGPTLGGLAGTWIVTAGYGFKWLFLANIIIGFALAIIMVFIPETLPRLVMAKAAGRPALAAKEPSQSARAYDSESQGKRVIVFNAAFALTESLRLLFTQPIILFTGIFNGIANGVLLLFITGIVTDYLRVKGAT